VDNFLDRGGLNQRHLKNLAKREEGGTGAKQGKPTPKCCLGKGKKKWGKDWDCGRSGGDDGVKTTTEKGKGTTKKNRNGGRRLKLYQKRKKKKKRKRRN